MSDFDSSIAQCVMDANADAAERPRTGRWQSPLFHFARLLKRHEELRRISGHEMLEIVLGGLRNAAPGTDNPWSAFRFDVGEEPEFSFLDAWRVAELPAGETILQLALDRATEHPLQEELATPRYTTFVGLVAWLSHIRGDGQAALPTRKIGDLFGVSYQTVACWIHDAVDRGFLTKTADASYNPGGCRRAATYRVNLAAIPGLPAELQRNGGPPSNQADYIKPVAYDPAPVTPPAPTTCQNANRSNRAASRPPGATVSRHRGLIPVGEVLEKTAIILEAKRREGRDTGGSETHRGRSAAQNNLEGRRPE